GRPFGGRRDLGILPLVFGRDGDGIRVHGNLQATGGGSFNSIVGFMALFDSLFVLLVLCVSWNLQVALSLGRRGALALPAGRRASIPPRRSTRRRRPRGASARSTSVPRR